MNPKDGMKSRDAVKLDIVELDECETYPVE